MRQVYQKENLEILKAGMILIYLRWGGTTLVFGQNVNYYLNGIYFVTYRIE